MTGRSWPLRAALTSLGLSLGLGLGAHPAPAAASPELPVNRIRAREHALSPARGVLEQDQITLHGVPVRGAHEVAIRAPDGARRVVNASLPTAPPQFRPAEARIDRAEAMAIAGAHAHAGPRMIDKPADDAQLVYVMILGAPVLVWEVEMPLVMLPEPSRRTIWVSAMTGRVLDERENVLASQAQVFSANPATTPVPITVTLSGVKAIHAGEPLVGTRVQAFNCTLEAPADPDSVSPWWDEGECYPVQRTMSDPSGNYFVPIPDVLYPEENIDGDDLYAELSMYYHAERFLDHLAGLGVPDFKCELSSMLANFRYQEIAISYPDLEYGPLNNAYFTNTCDPEKGPTMIFGQGSSVDFGYDGDVVYHELGHGVVSLLAPDGLGGRRLRPDASLTDAGGLNEALADYFSAMITHDPELGNYVARFWPTYGSSAIRNAENAKTCPDNTIGQVHNDGEPFMAALWAARKRIGGKVDYAVLEMLMRLSSDADLEEASHTLLGVANERKSAGEWSDVDLQHLTRAFDDRGLYACERVIRDEKSVSTGRTMYLRPYGNGVAPFYPGPMQLRHVVPEGSDNIVVRFRLGPRGTSTGNPITSPVGALVLIKRGEDAPIQFEYDLSAVESTTDPATSVNVKEVVTVRGDWTIEQAASLVVNSENQLVIRGFHPGEVVHVTLVNIATAEAVAGSVSVISVDPDLLDHGSLPSDGIVTSGADSETGGEAAGGEDSLRTGDVGVACACREGGSGGGAPAIGFAGAILLWLRRRSWRARS
ncbi:MAG: hypothetical protein R3B09_22480 [Nannocystaceae bacterium]